MHNQGTTFSPQDSRTLFFYLPNTKSKWNKFQCEILDNSNYDSFHDGGGFSHVYITMHKYFAKKLK
jgi:hypothetical protein